MDEFAKITPAQRKILEVLASLQPYEKIEIMADKDGKFDTFWIKRESKVMVVGAVFNFTR